MTVIAIKQFSGVAPRVPPRYLQDAQAQTALNCPVFNGPLQPLRGAGAAVATLPKVGTVKSLYRFGLAEPYEDRFWFHWLDDVDVAKGPVANDTNEVTVFTGLDKPRITTTALATTGGSNYPIASWALGVPAPASPPLAYEIEGTSDGSGIVETRVYVITWVNALDQESAPSEPMIPITIDQGQSVKLKSFPDVPLGDWSLTKRRIYRSVNGTYLLVGEVAAATVEFLDDKQADDLAEELPSLTWEMPPETLKGIVSSPGGFMAGFSGFDVYFSEVFRPFAWPIEYMQTVDYPVVGIGVMDTTFAVLTTGAPYFMQGASPDSITVVKSDIQQACASKRSIVSYSGSVIYASPDGLVLLSPGGSRILTEGLFTREQWQTINPSSIHAYQHDNKYIAFFDNNTAAKGFIYDFGSGAFVLHDIEATAGYNDLVNDTLFLCGTDNKLRKWEAGAAKAYTWRSKIFVLPRPGGFSSAAVEAVGYPVTCAIYRDGVLHHSQSVTSRNPFRLPSGVGREWEVELAGETEVFSVALAEAMSELANV